MRTPRFVFCRCLWLAGCLSATSVARAGEEQALPDVAERLDIILQAGPEGVSPIVVRRARDELAERGIEILPQLLAAMDTKNVIAANWLRTIYDPLIDRELAHPHTKWPKDELKAYVNNASRSGRPRELVLALLDKLEPDFRAAWLPTRLDDPDFRFDAVAAALTNGERAMADKQLDQARIEFRKAFRAARDANQVTQAATQLRQLQEPADVAKQLGLMTTWQLIGPFAAPGKTGFAAEFPPETKVDLQGEYLGQENKPLRWMTHETKDVLGQVNLNEALAACREAVGYAYAEIQVADAGPAQLRCSADDNCSVWLNGEKVFGRDQWLNGTRFDRFVTDIQLAEGKNVLLVKICQGPQHRDPEVPNNWTFQLRLCDRQGLGIPFTTVPPAINENK